MRRALVFLLGIALCASGCSVVFVTKPPSDPSPRSYPNCHDASAAPAVDLLYAIVVAAVSVNEESLTGALVAVPFAASGLAGFLWTQRCAELRKKWKGPGREDLSSEAQLPSVSPVPTEGAKGGRCYPNATCNAGLYCDPELHRCRPGNTGLEGGRCFANGSCNALFELCCAGGVCVRALSRDCESDEHCPDGEVCVQGYCLTLVDALVDWQRSADLRCPKEPPRVGDEFYREQRDAETPPPSDDERNPELPGE